MIKGIGCDIVEHKLTSKLGWDKKTKRLSRIFSKKELSNLYSNKKIEFLSGRFAAKEAILKCLGTAIEDGITLADVQILRDKNGKPTVKLHGTIKAIAEKLKVRSIQISISHSTKYSVAFAIAEGT